MLLVQELGECESVDMVEIGGTNVVFFRTEPKETRMSTILIRGATPNILDDVERAIDDGVNVYKVSRKRLNFEGKGLLICWLGC